MIRTLITVAMLLTATTATAQEFDREAAIEFILEAAQEHDPNAGVTRQLLDKTSGPRLRMALMMAHCQSGELASAKFIVLGPNFIGVESTTCAN